MKVLIFFGKGKKSDWRYQSFLGVRQSSYILSWLPSCGGILPPVEAELDFRLISLIHAPAMCNLHVGEIFIFLQFDHVTFPMLIFLVAFPANFTNMGTSQGLT